MAKEIVLFKSEERKDQQGVSAFLHQLADRLAQNQIALRRGEEKFVPDFPNKSVLELRIEEVEKKIKPSVRLR
jgi:amphi-Trp domain-containing protein